MVLPHHFKALPWTETSHCHLGSIVLSWLVQQAWHFNICNSNKCSVLSPCKSASQKHPLQMDRQLQYSPMRSCILFHDVCLFLSRFLSLLCSQSAFMVERLFSAFNFFFWLCWSVGNNTKCNISFVSPIKVSHLPLLEFQKLTQHSLNET